MTMQLFEGVTAYIEHFNSKVIASISVNGKKQFELVYNAGELNPSRLLADVKEKLGEV